MTDYIELLLELQEQEESGQTQLELKLGRAVPAPPRPASPADGEKTEEEERGEGREDPALPARSREAHPAPRAAQTLFQAAVGGYLPAVRTGLSRMGTEEGEEKTDTQMWVHTLLEPGRTEAMAAAAGIRAGQESRAEAASNELLEWAVHGSAARARSEAEIYLQLRQAGQAAQLAMRPTGVLTAAETETAGLAEASAGQLDRLFQRDARRYDGGFSLL